MHFLSLGMSVKFSNAENTGQAVILLYMSWQSLSFVTWERGQLDFFQNCLSIIIMSCKLLHVHTLMYFSERAPAFCQIVSALCYTLKSLFLSLLSCIPGAVFTSPVWQTAHSLSHPWKELVFPSCALLSDAILSILHCFWELSAAFHCSVYNRFMSESLSVGLQLGTFLLPAHPCS